MSKEIVARRMLLGMGMGMGMGVGAIALAARRAEADVPFSSFAFAATGSPTARTMPDRLAEIKNVKDFGARGLGSTDDTAAIQAAVNWSPGPNRGTIYFPVGMYRITAPITFQTAPINLRFLGDPGATIVGNFADALLKRDIENVTSGIRIIENLRFVNEHAAGKSIVIGDCVGAKVVNCHISSFIGIECGTSSCLTVDTCSLISPNDKTGIGIAAENATTVLNCDITHFASGIRHCNLGLNVIGGRIEVNTYGIEIGRKRNTPAFPNGEVFTSNGFLISGLSMESNVHGIYIVDGAAGHVTGCGITNNVTGNASGIYIANASNCSFTGISVSTGHSLSDAGIYMNNPLRCTFDAIGISDAAGTAWRLPTGGQLASLSFRCCSPVVEGSVTVAHLASHASAAPIGTILRVSNANTSTIGAKITSSGAHNVMALKIHGNKWTVLGPGT